jgi:hypothetical protein
MSGHDDVVASMNVMSEGIIGENEGFVNKKPAVSAGEILGQLNYILFD